MRDIPSMAIQNLLAQFVQQRQYRTKTKKRPDEMHEHSHKTRHLDESAMIVVASNRECHK